MKTQYTIHDVAALLGISADAIRLYEKEGLVETRTSRESVKDFPDSLMIRKKK